MAMVFVRISLADFDRLLVKDPNTYYVIDGKNIMYEGADPTPVNALVTEWEPSVISIQIITPPNKVTYNDGEALDLTGLVVQASYDNGTSTIIADYTTSPTQGTILKPEDTGVVISYHGKTCTQPITVNVTSVLNRITYTGTWCYTGWLAASALQDLGQNFDAVKTRSDLCVALKTSGDLTFKTDGAIDAFYVAGGGSGAVNVYNYGFDPSTVQIDGNNGTASTAFSYSSGSGGSGGKYANSYISNGGSTGGGVLNQAGGNGGSDGSKGIGSEGTSQGYTTKAFGNTLGYLFAGGGGGAYGVNGFATGGIGGVGGGTNGTNYKSNSCAANTGSGSGACATYYDGVETSTTGRGAGGGASGHTATQANIEVTADNAYTVTIGQGGAGVGNEWAKSGDGGSGIILIKVHQ